MRDYIDECIDYVLETEAEDYFNWCDEMKKDQNDFINNANEHIFAAANIAFQQRVNEKDEHDNTRTNAKH